MCQSEMDGKYDTALAPIPRLLFGQQLLLLLFILLSCLHGNRGSTLPVMIDNTCFFYLNGTL